MSLELIGHLAGPAGIVGPYEFPLVYGSGDARHVTLRGCHITGTSFSMPVETQRETAVVETALIGAHVAEFIVTELEVGFEHLADWTLLPTPMVTPTDSPDRGPAVRIDYAAPAPLEAAIGGDTVRLEFSWRPGRSPAGDLALERPVRFVVRLGTPMSLDVAEDQYIRPLQNLLTLAVGRAEAITDLEVELAPESFIADAAPGQMQRAQVFHSSHVLPTDSRRAIARHDLLFTLADIGESFGSAMNGWIRASTELRAASNLFFGNHYAPPVYVETRFLVFCQAAEVLHSARSGNTIRDPREFQFIVEDVLAAVPEQHRDLVAGALQQSNNIRLRQRLTELARAAPSSVRDVIGDPAAFAGAVTEARNAYSHGSTSGAADGANLHRLSQKLRLVLQAAFLSELALPPEVLDARMAASRLVREVRQFG